MKDWNEDLLTEKTVYETREVIFDKNGKRVTKDEMLEGEEYSFGLEDIEF